MSGMMENKTADFIDHDGTRYWYEYKLAKDRIDICLATTDPKKYCNGTYLYSTKDPGDGMAFVVIKSESVDVAFQKEQFETQQSVHYWAGRLIGHEQAYDIADEIVEAITYASQQCLDMQAEKERLELSEVKWFQRCAELQEEIERLKAENERLTILLRSSREYVQGAYECAFPNQQDNDELLEAIDKALNSKQ